MNVGPEKIVKLATVAGRLAVGLARYVELSEALQVDAQEMAAVAASLADDVGPPGDWLTLNN